VAYVPQRSEINWTFPICVGKLVLTGRYVHLGWLRRPRQRDREIAEAMLARLGLTALANRHIGQLSGGQQQRVLLARALAQEADILLLDEPFTAVDVAMQERLSAILADLQQHGTTLLMATHNLGQHAAAFDGVLYLCGGRVCAPPQGNITPRRLEVP
jgi:ABC-type Mn2+/Zn2+ transport system ATPase subunit